MNMNNEVNVNAAVDGRGERNRRRLKSTGLEDVSSPKLTAKSNILAHSHSNTPVDSAVAV